MIQNRYLIVHAIGKGGMGEVYLSVDQRLGSAVALKRTFFTEDNSLAAAFEREARILARLRHPVLPKVIDHFVENGDQYLVMEHISGDDLSKRLESANKPFPLSWVMFWADQLLDALSYLHSHEPPIIHRDIKPQNLKLTDENHIVLLDFGLSKDFDTKSTSNPLNSASVAGYSPHFASMEQIRGTGTDARSDLYSLSATLYQLLTNTIPVDALTRADALLGNKPDPIVPLTELNSEVSAAISDVILKGVALRQEERFSTAGEMQKALRRAFDRGKKAEETEKPETLPEVPAVAVAVVDSLPSEMKTRALGDTGQLAMAETVQMTSTPAASEARQSDVKTEMFSSPEQPEVETKLASAVSAPGIHEAKSAEPTAATPVAAAASASASPTPVAATNAPLPKKGGGSKVGLIVGGLLVLLVIAAAGGGGGYYLYLRQSAASANSPEPTPAATAETVPTPANELPSNSAEAPSVSNSAVPESEANTSTSSPRTDQQGQTRQQPARTPQAPTVKATPKPKPKDDRTVIIQ